MGVFDKIKNLVPDGLETAVKIVGEGIAKKSESNNSNQASGSQKQSGWSSELENLVDMAIEDGELTDRELQLLASRAQREGIDPDEFELVIRLRMRQRAKDAEKKTDNPVDALSQAFSMLEQYKTGGQSAISASALSSALSIIPGIGQVAAVGGLLAQFIETPSNINSLKAELIRLFVLPDNPTYLNQFISYGASQIKEIELGKDASKYSVTKIMSGVFAGSDIDLLPIWEQKIDDACDAATLRYPDDAELQTTVKKYRPTLINKLRDGRIPVSKMAEIAAPKNDDELLEVIEFLFNKRNNDKEWNAIKPAHARLYKEAERRFASDEVKMNKLNGYKIKKFGIF
jgi:hypothetical protein